MDKYGLLLAKLEDDRTSGSEQLLGHVLDILRESSSDLSVSPEEQATLLEKIVGIINEKFIELAPLRDIASKIASLSKENLKKSANELEGRIRSKINSEVASLARIGANLVPQNSTIATISNSDTIVNVLFRAKGMYKDFHVITAISEPAGEGRLMAKTLADKGIDVTLVPDAAMGYAIERSNMVMVGADAVTGEFFINKIGSLPMALSAKHFNIPFYVFARLDKFLPSRSLPLSRRFIGPEELNPPESELITAKAPLFERIPHSLVDGIVTESGIIKPERNRLEIAEVTND
ncbi:hypothetical protein KAH81_07690 [bacterium]|nr:hypothetical protein [bacterium]